MKRIIRFNRTYFFLAIALFLVEVFIGTYVHDSIIRPYGGDYLVVMLIYCFVKAFLDTPVIATATGVLLFAYAIEGLQYLHIVRWLGLEQHKLARIIIGTSFAWSDIVAYTLGIITLIALEYTLKKKHRSY